MNIAICDDLVDSLEETKSVVEQIPYVTCIDTFSDIENLFHEITDGKQYDVVLMDINWNTSRTGIDYAADLHTISPYTKIIFVTAYTMDYVEEIFLKASSLSGFLLKPVKYEQLEKNLDKIKNLREDVEKKLVIRYKGSIPVIPFKDIIYLESQLHKIRIYTDNTIYECGERLDHICERLDDRFLRCHKSYVVNMDAVREFRIGEVVLRNEMVIPVSKKRYGQAKNEFYEFVSKE